MQRRPTTQDISWLLDLHRNKQLDLDPPYQRRSVWTKRDKQFFLDTVFRNYPSPAIFLHKTIEEDGKTIYHVVDGKQRTQTILEFISDGIRIDKDFGDKRLNGKVWSQLDKELDLKKKFWNYQLTVEVIDFTEGKIVNEVFDRLNRNARKLTEQELRHAKFDGWLIKTAESEAENDLWWQLGLVTPARARRMADVQFISELMFVVLEREMIGFDHDLLDSYYAKYEEPEEVEEFNEVQFKRSFEQSKKYIAEMERAQNAITNYGSGLNNFYTLWALITLEKKLPPPKELSAKYSAFMTEVEDLASKMKSPEDYVKAAKKKGSEYIVAYLNNLRGANTDLAQRIARYEALKAVIFS